MIDSPLTPFVDEGKNNSVFLEDEATVVEFVETAIVKPPIPIAPILNDSLRQTLVRHTKLL